MAGRPGEIVGPQPSGPGLGHQGPDQGFALTLAQRFVGSLHLTAGEHERDALAGAAAVAMRRAGLFGRGPSIHDLTVALTVWGFLGPPAAELVEFRRGRFAEVSHPHHYLQLRRLVDTVPEWVLRLAPDAVHKLAANDWRSSFSAEPRA